MAASGRRLGGEFDITRWRRTGIPRGLLLSLLLLAAFTAIVAIEFAGLFSAVADLRDGTADLQRSMATLGPSPGGWTAGRVETAAAAQTAGMAKIDRGNRRLQHDFLLWSALHVPLLRDQIRTAIDLGDAADQSARAEGDLVVVAKLYSNRPPTTSDPGVEVIKLLRSAGPALNDADTRLAAADAHLNSDRSLRLWSPLRSQLDRAFNAIRPAAKSANTASQLGRLLPGILGDGRTKTYLILLANPSELRPSGGFAGEVGAVTFENGRASSITFRDQYDVSGHYKDKFPPMGQLGTYLSFLNGQAEIGDAGWDPNFPASAKLQQQMYASGTGQHVDGTISVDPYVISNLLKVTGPVDVPGYGSFDSENLFLRVNVLTNLDRSPTGGKRALPVVATAIFAKILSLPSTRWPEMAAALQVDATDRHLQVSVDDPSLQSILDEQRWNGALITLPLTDDFLMVAEANVAANKADYYIKRSMSVKVEIYPSGLNRHEIDIHYEYPSPTDSTAVGLTRPDLNPTGRYRDYVRFYLPLTATLANVGFLVDGKPAPAFGGGQQEHGQEQGHQVFGTFFILPQGHTADLVIYYEVGLPADPPYTLFIQKQAGIPDLPTRLTVSYPGGIANRSTDLRSDATLRVPW